VRNVAFDGNSLAVLALDRGNDLFGRRLIAGVTDHDPKAARRSAKRGGAADAAASAGDNRNPVRQVSPHNSDIPSRNEKAVLGCTSHQRRVERPNMSEGI